VGVRRGVQRVPLREAAQLLGVSKDAVRQRIRRGTIRSEKGEDGRVYVFVDASPDAARPQADHAGHAYVQAEGARQHADPAPLVEELHEQVRYLRALLTEEQDARRRADTVIAQLSAANAEQARTIRAIEAPASQEPPEATYDSAATEQPGRVGPQTEVESPQEPAESPEMPADEQQGRGPVPDAGGAQETTEALGGPSSGTARGSWWRRMLGG
jgi:hypothetical protein